MMRCPPIAHTPDVRLCAVAEGASGGPRIRRSVARCSTCRARLVFVGERLVCPRPSCPFAGDYPTSTEISGRAS